VPLLHPLRRTGQEGTGDLRRRGRPGLDHGTPVLAEALKRGVYFHSLWHHGISVAHTDQDIKQVIQVTEEAAKAVAQTPEGQGKASGTTGGSDRSMWS